MKDDDVGLMGQEKVCSAPLTLMDEEKMHVDNVAFSKIILGIPVSLFEHIKL